MEVLFSFFTVPMYKVKHYLRFRLSAALAEGRALDLINAAVSEQALQSLYGADIPTEFSGCRVGEVDTISQRLLEMYQPVFLQQYVPLSVLWDGHCLYRAVSRSLCGNESLHIL